MVEPIGGAESNPPLPLGGSLRNLGVPMKLLDRYVTRHVLVTASFAVAVLSVVLVLGNVFKQLLDLLVNQSVPLEFILSFIGYILPFSLTFTLPWGFLTAVLLVFGKMSAENELIALRSSGVSIPRICLPVGGIALAFVGICLWINVQVAPRAQVKMKEALYNIATNNPLSMFGSDKVIDEFPGKKIYVEHNEGAQLRNILVYELDRDSSLVKVVFAKEGKIDTDVATQRLLLHLYDVKYEQRDEKNPASFVKINQGISAESTTFPISLQELYEKNKKRRGLSTLTIGELQDRIRQNEKAKAAAATPKEVKKSQEEQSSARTEFSKRFSFALASLAFGLIGVPLAITAHRKETSVGFLLSLIVAFVYFFFIILADTFRANPKWHPEWLIWTPNILFLGLGAWLFRRLSRQ
jgi:LPS export ABC transporter permease LptF